MSLAVNNSLVPRVKRIRVTFKAENQTLTCVPYFASVSLSAADRARDGAASEVAA